MKYNENLRTLTAKYIKEKSTGNIYTNIVYLGCNSSPDDFVEVTKQAYLQYCLEREDQYDTKA